MNKYVVKRSGKKEQQDVAKVKGVITWACEGLDVNPLKLESKIESVLVDGVSTLDIHNNIIYHAQSLASAEEPDWVYVAGRCNSMKRWKDTQSYSLEFGAFINDMKEAGRYTHPNIDKYTDEEIAELDKHINMEMDLEHSYGSTLTANKKYLLEGECLQHMFMVQSMIIFADKGKNRITKVLELYKALSERKVSLATPWLSNLRSNGNISSCFIISLDDNIDSIADGWKKAAKISKMGGGLGIYMGNLRAKGGTVAGRPNSAKSICMPIKIMNDIAQYVDQGGEFRHAA